MIKYYRAIPYQKISQYFGESRVCAKVDANGKALRPWVLKEVKTTETACPAGYSKFYPLLGMNGHNGKDRPAPMFTRMYHPCSFTGKMRNADDMDGGLGVDVISHEPILTCTEGCGQKHYVKWRGWHMAERPVLNGTEVHMGQFVGTSDSTGASSGPHLHDSLKWCDADGNGIHSDNGFFGAIDADKHPEVQVIDTFVLDVLQVEQRHNYKPRCSNFQCC